MNLIERLNKKGDKITFYYDFGRGKGQRPSTGVFIYTNPKSAAQKNHNKQALALLEVKKSQLTIESQATGTAFIPEHLLKKNFLDYFQVHVDQHKDDGNKHFLPYYCKKGVD